MKKMVCSLLLICCITAFSFSQKKKIKRQQVAITKIEWVSFTRQSRTTISITKDTAKLIENASEKFMLVSKLQWAALIKTIQTVPLSAIPLYEPPSKNHQLDGAAHTNITVFTKRTLYRTKTFDAGNPHKQLLALNNAIDSIRNELDEKGESYEE